MVSNSHEWLTDPRGNPSRWIALCFAALFAVAAVAAALAGQGGHVTAVLGGLFGQLEAATVELRVNATCGSVNIEVLLDLK